MQIVAWFSSDVNTYEEKHYEKIGEYSPIISFCYPLSALSALFNIQDAFLDGMYCLALL